VSKTLDKFGDGKAEGAVNLTVTNSTDGVEVEAVVDTERVAEEKKAEAGLSLYRPGGGGQMEEIKKLTREDDSLELWTRLGDAGEKGFTWENGLFIKREVDDLLFLV